QPPEFTGRYATSSTQWTNTSGNVWQITLSATQAISQLKFVQFGSIWGNVQASQAAVVHKRDWYDSYGVQVQGASDHIWLANILADSQVPNGAVPLGFYIHSSSTPGDIHLYNTDAHRNYMGYQFDNAATAIELKNCRAYANRTYGLMDN